MTRTRKHVQESPLRLVKPAAKLAVIGIDAGKASGACFMIGGKHPVPVQVGDVAADRRMWIVVWVAIADREGATVVAVVEKSGNYGGGRTTRGLGAAVGRWKEQLELAGIPKRRIIDVDVNKWRKAIFGTASTRIGSDAWKTNAIQLCRQLYNIDLADKPDAAEATLIARWGTHAPEVLELLPKRRAR